MKLDKFIKDMRNKVIETAEKCLSKLTAEDLQRIKDNPKGSLSHFTYGMYIRNTYLLGIDDDLLRDDMSAMVIDEMKSRIIPGYTKEEW